MFRGLGVCLSVVVVSLLVGCSTIQTVSPTVDGDRQEARNPAGGRADGESVLARQALNNAGRVLRGKSKAVNLIGINEKGRLCELELSEDRGGYVTLVDDEIKVGGRYKKSGLRFSDDSIYNPYYAITNEKASVESNSIGLNSDGLNVIDISVASGVDHSRAELHVEFDTINRMIVNGKPFKDRLVSGFFRYDRGGGPDKVQVCSLQLVVTGDELTSTNSVLESLELGRKF